MWKKTYLHLPDYYNIIYSNQELKRPLLFTIAKCWKQPKCPAVNEWIKKLWYIYTLEYYAAERKKELLPFATEWMELESIMLMK